MATESTIAQPDSIFAMAQRQFDETAEILKLDDNMRGLLRECKRELTVTFPPRWMTIASKCSGDTGSSTISRAGRPRAAFATIMMSPWTR